jgi:A/G-specific adenine glycosylase
MPTSAAPLPPKTATAIRRALLAFYDRSRRDLPWRRTSDPYCIWISEVMLQQTRVEAVIPYYERWLARFPTVQALAEAPPDDVLKAWEGLGYYSRARNLHRAARILAAEHAGALPRDPATLRALPGVGEYTAGAVASIAYDVRAPAVDGNVRRVLARLLDVPVPCAALLRDAAGALVPTRRAGDFNQALMELGATICTPTNPSCGTCAIARHCVARANGTQAVRPTPRRRAPVPSFDLGTAVVRDASGRILLVRRPDEGLLAGLWSFPSSALGRDAGAAEAKVAAATAFESETFAAAASAAAAAGVHVDAAGTLLGTVEHAFTHRRERYHVVAFTTSEGERDHDRVRFVTGEELHALALPTAQRRIARLAGLDNRQK